MNALEKILNQHHNIKVEQAYNEMRLLVPFYHEDGDMYELFIKQVSSDEVLLYDNGLSLMRLSYSFTLDSEKKIDILNRILRENGVDNDNGNLSIRTNINNFVTSLNQFCTTIAKITNMNILSKEVISSMFYEYLDEYISNEVSSKYKIERNYRPANTDLTVRAYRIATPKPLFLFPIKDSISASRAVIVWNDLKKIDNNFRGVSVCDEFDNLPKIEKYYLMNSLDKTYPKLDEFKQTFPEYITRFAS